MQNTIELEGYHINERIFESSKTLVYRGTDKKDNRAVVIKLLNKQYPSPEELSKFRREYNIAKNLKVEGVVDTMSLQKYGNTLLIVMEDFFGDSINELIQKKEISLKEFLSIGIRIAETLSEIHKQSVIHKDINPANIVWNRSDDIVKIIDFSISTQLSSEITEIMNPDHLEGTLGYISPEQTGRINRSIDYRTDLYSLGVTFYELLTKQLPFKGNDSMELVHSHIAKIPVPPNKINKNIPEVISDIIMKLLDKNSEKRYQNTLGLKYDLEQCLEQLNLVNTIKSFPIGQKDFSEKFQIPQKLYGRETETNLLVNIFNKATEGLGELVLVSGKPGIGKTALVKEILKPIVEKNGFFIKGKYDQFNVNVPYSAIYQAFISLIREILSEPEEILNNWRKEFLEAFGPNGQIVIDLIPDIEQIIGKQPPVQELNPTEAQNRFLMIFRNFVKVISKSDHPLVLFLDDMQWCDQSSLNLIKDLITKKVPHFMFICAYRDNEVGEGHPFKLTLEEISKTHQYQKLLLEPLDENSVVELITDTMHCDINSAKSLSDIVYKKTKGNPFFINELLKGLHKENLFNFNQKTGTWIWELDKIKNTKISDNVVEFVIDRLRKLPAESVLALKLASCIGNSFDLKTISIIMQTNRSEVSNILWNAVKEEVIFIKGNTYTIAQPDENELINYKYEFQHDRIQQAAYSLIEDHKKKETHLKIGQLSLNNFSESEIEEHLIEIVNHLNIGQELIQETKERKQLIQLNLSAGKKAQSASAYSIAIGFYEKGILMLQEDSWQTNYELTYGFFKGFAQCAYQIDRQDDAEKHLDILLNHAQTKIEKADIISMRLRQYTTVGKINEAIEQGIKGLNLLGVKISDKPGMFSILSEIVKAKIRIGKKKIPELIDLPVLEDPEYKMVVRLLSEMGAPAYVLGNDNLFGLLSLKVVNISLKYGNSPESPYAYIAYGMLLSLAFGDYKSSFELGKLAININEKLNDIEYRCRIIGAYCALTHHFNYHWSTYADWFLKGVKAGFSSGDIFYLAYNAGNYTLWNPKINIKDLINNQMSYFSIVQETKYEDAYDTYITFLQKYRNFQGNTSDRYSLSDENYDENERIESMHQRKYFTGICIFYFHKSDIFLFYDKYEKAYEYVKKTDKVEKAIVGLAYIVLHSVVAFHSASACFADDSITSFGKAELKKRMKKELKKMKKWAKYNPANYQHLLLTMQAEMAKHEKKFHLAIVLYNQAIKEANKNEWWRDEAFANELAAKLYLDLNQEKAAVGHIQEAHYHYNKWGASAKVKFLEEKYANLLQSFSSNLKEDKNTHTTTSSISETYSGTQSGTLDMFTIMKSSQTISGEIVLETLLKKLMEIVIENAGAQRGILLLKQEKDFSIQAEINIENAEVAVLQNISLIDYKRIPALIINYVARTSKSIVLSNAISEGQFTNDPYIMDSKPLSVLALPIIKQKELYGILYLENNLTSGAFTAERQKVLNILSSQIAISVDNAILYENLEQKVRERTEKYLAINEELKTINEELQNEITERQKVEKSLIEKKEELQESNATKDKFFSIIAHDLRNPFIAIMGFTDLMIQNFNEYKDDKKLVFLGHINQAVKNTYKLLENLLVWSRSQQGIIEFNPEKENLYLISTETIDLLTESAKSKSISIINNVNPDITVEADRNMLQTILRNLISNAIKFTNKDGEIVIDTSNKLSTNGRDYIEVSVSDNGVGIPSERINTLFKVSETTSTKGTDDESGTGLGLNICHDFIKKHGGKIWVDSVIGNGSKFNFTIPVS